MPGAVDDVLGLDVAVRRADAGDRAARGVRNPVTGDALDDPRALQPGALGQRHRDVDRVGPAVVGDVEAGQDVVRRGPAGTAP